MSTKYINTRQKKASLTQGNSPFWKRNAYPLIIFIFSLALYANSLFNGYNLDDELVTRNHPLTSQGFKAIPEILSSPYYKDDMGYAYDYRPLVHVSFAVEHQLFGESAFVSHTINLILYIICCLLFYFVLIQSFGTSSFFSISVTLLFVAFPLHTEAVCSIKNRDELLSLLFAMSACLLMRKIFLNAIWWCALLSILFALSLLSKYSSVVFAFIIPTVFFIQHKPTVVHSIGVSIALAMPSVILFQQPSLKYRLEFTAIILLFPILFYIPYRAVGHKLFVTFQALFQLFQGLKKQGQKVLLFVRHEFEKFIPQLNTPHAIGFVGNIYYGSIYITVSVSILFASTFFMSLFFLGRTSLGVWVIVTVLLLLLLRESLLRHLLSIIFLVGLFLLLLFWRDIDSNNPLPILITTYTVIVVVMLCQKHIQPPLTWIYLGITGFVVIFQLLVIRDVGSLFPLLGGLSVWLSRENKILFYTSKYVTGILVLVEAVVFTVALIKSQPTVSIVFEMATLFCLSVIWGLINKPDKYEIFRKLTLLVFAVITIFYLPNLRLPMFFKGQVYSLTTITNHLMVGREEHKQQRLPLEKVNHQSEKPLEIELLSIRSDRQIHYVESPVTIWDSFSTRVASASVVALHYFRKILVPYPMAFYYGYKVFKEEKLSSLPVILSIIIHITIVVLMMYCWANHQLLALSMFIYLLSVAALSGFLQTIAGVFADRFALIPSLGFCIVFVSIVFAVFKKDVYSRSVEYGSISTAMKFVFFSVALVYSGITIARNAQWKDDLTLMRNDIKYVGESAQANNLLAIHLINASFQEADPNIQLALRNEALTHFKKAQQIYPPFFNVAFDIGRTYILLNKPDSAIAAFKYSLTLDTTYSGIYLNLGEQCMNAKRYSEAATYLTKYTQMQPNEYNGYDKLSYVYYQMGNYEASIQTNKLAIIRIPNIADPYANIGRVYLVAQQRDSAIYYLTLADKMVPGNQQIQLFLQQAKSLK